MLKKQVHFSRRIFFGKKKLEINFCHRGRIDPSAHLLFVLGLAGCADTDSDDDDDDNDADEDGDNDFDQDRFDFVPKRAVE